MQYAPRRLAALAAMLMLLTAFTLDPAQAAQREPVREFALNDVAVLEIIDAPLTFQTSMWRDIDTRPDMQAKMPAGKFETYSKVFVVKTGDRIVLIDAGAGSEHYAAKGETAARLKKLGIAPEDVTDILMTHLDVDHVGGLVVGADATYPKARLHVSKPEHEAWTNDKGLINRESAHKALNKLVLAAYGERLRLFDFDDAVVPGITALDASGHTPGHTAYEIVSGDKGMLVAGDFMHIAPIQLPAPEESTVWDAQPKAGETRRRILERLSDSDVMLAAMHIDEIGHVRRNPSGGFIMTPVK